MITNSGFGTDSREKLVKYDKNRDVLPTTAHNLNEQIIRIPIRHTDRTEQNDDIFC